MELDALFPLLNAIGSRRPYSGVDHTFSGGCTLHASGMGRERRPIRFPSRNESVFQKVMGKSLICVCVAQTRNRLQNLSDIWITFSDFNRNRAVRNTVGLVSRVSSKLIKPACSARHHLKLPHFFFFFSPHFSMASRMLFEGGFLFFFFQLFFRFLF